MLNAIIEQKEFKKTLDEMGINEDDFSEPLIQYLSAQEIVPGNNDYTPDPSRDFQGSAWSLRAIAIMSAGGHDVPHISTHTKYFREDSQIRFLTFP